MEDKAGDIFVTEVKKLPEGGVLILKITDQSRENYSIGLYRNSLDVFSSRLNSLGPSDSVCLVSLLMRPRASLFWTILEHTWFDPTGPNEKLFVSAWTRWQDQLWTIGVIPREFDWALEATAKLTKMHINKNPPAMIASTGVSYFSVPWSWTLENGDPNAPHYQATAAGIEELCKGTINGEEFIKKVQDAERAMILEEREEINKFRREHGLPEVT